MALPRAKTLPPSSAEQETSFVSQSQIDEEKDQSAWDSSGHSSQEQTSDISHEPESDIVDWDGPHDPKNPMNWPVRKKIVSTVTVSLMTLITPLGSSMFAPGVPQVMDEFHSSSPVLASFVVSDYLLGYAFGPLLLAPISELYGRIIVYNVCNVLYLVFTIACAAAPNLAGLMVFRVLAGMTGSAPLTIGVGTLADMIQADKRGLAMGAWVLGSVLGPVIGPVGRLIALRAFCDFADYPAGGYLTQAMGWRWTFWLLAMAATGVTANTAIFLRESYAPVLLSRKVKRLRKETGNSKLRSILDTDRSFSDVLVQSMLRPTKMLFLSPIVLILSIYIAVLYGYLYLMFTTIPDVFSQTYSFSAGSVGLAYLGIGVGSVVGLIFQTACSDRIFRRLATKHGQLKPEFRLPTLFFSCWLISISLFWYGWTAEYKMHWMLPIAGTSLVGFGMISAFTAISEYLVDAYTVHAASAVAANTVLRSLGGAFLPLAGGSMYAAMGLGWGNSLLAFVALAMCPLPFIFYRYGEWIRKSRPISF